MDCAPTEADCGFASNQPLEFAFDRWLLPSTATRQSIRVSALGTEGQVLWAPQYDVLTRTITYRPRGGWDEGFIFDLQLFDPTTPDWGFRSYDGQLLDPSGLPAHVLFRVGPPILSLGSDSGAAPATCREALTAFAAAGCSGSTCHRSASGCTASSCQGLPRAGLALDSAAGLAGAVGRVARATDRGAVSGNAEVMPERFGVNMALLQANEPSLSLVVMRMLLGRDAYRDADGNFAVTPPSDDELDRAISWFGVSGPMPPLQIGWPQGVSPVELVSTVQRWIRDGAPTTNCD